jgi:UDP-N-acetylmuramate dehydrogenase
MNARLHSAFPDTLREQVPLAPYTTLRIGGPADYLLEANTPEDIVTAYRITRDEHIPFLLLAGCSNVLISDDGIRGLVLINKTSAIQWHANYTVTVDSGYGLDTFVVEASERGWGDVSFAAGIPGSLGGALIGGAGAFGHLVHEYLIEADVLQRSGDVTTMRAEELGIGYRTSEARTRGDMILRALMGPFQPGDRAKLVAECHRIKAEREGKHPDCHRPSAGSFFKNLPPAAPGDRRQAAGKYLDEVGAKTLRVGDAGVFEHHANIIVNYGNATANEVNQLADLMAERVKERFGIILEREVRYLE